MQITQEKRQFIVENEQRCTDVWLMARTVSTCISRSFPDAPLDASLHSTIHTFRRCLAVCCCFVAATGSPSRAPLLCWLHGQARPLLPGGVASAGLAAALAGSFVVSVGNTWTGVGDVHDVVWHLQYHGA